MASSQQSRTSDSSAFDPKPHRFCDDEPLPASNVHVVSATSAASLPKVTVTAIPECPDVSASVSRNQFRVLVKLKAPPMSEYSHPLKRAPIDLVLVLDISEKINKSRLDNVKNAVRFVIENLGPSDRLSIVSSSPHARRILPLRRMTKRGQEDTKPIVSSLVTQEIEHGQEDTKRTVSSLVIQGSTDFVEGLTMAARVLEERQHQNPVASIILLSNRRNTRNRVTLKYVDQLPHSICPVNGRANDRDFHRRTFPVYAFGVGPDHNPHGLHAISSAADGTYSFVHSYDILQHALACCIGGLLSVVTQEFRLVIAGASSGVKISSVFSGQFDKSISEARTICEIKVGDLYADEQKQFMISLSLPKVERAGEKSHISIIGFYKDAVTGKTVEMDCDFIEIRRPTGPSPERNTECVEIKREKTRLIAAGSIKGARVRAIIHNLSRAHAFMLGRINEMWSKECVQRGDGLCLWLLEEMCGMERRLRSKPLYERGGTAFALSNESSHATQRATTRGFQVLGASGINFEGYATPNMVELVIKSELSPLLKLRMTV